VNGVPLSPKRSKRTWTSAEVIRSRNVPERSCVRVHPSNAAAGESTVARTSRSVIDVPSCVDWLFESNGTVADAPGVR
jgi:hypothetical protein